MSINLQITELRGNLIQQINDSGLPITVVYLLMKDLMSEIENMNSTVINKEVEEARQMQAQAQATEAVEEEDTEEVVDEELSE